MTVVQHFYVWEPGDHPRRFLVEAADHETARWAAAYDDNLELTADPDDLIVMSKDELDAFLAEPLT